MRRVLVLVPLFMLVALFMGQSASAAGLAQADTAPSAAVPELGIAPDFDIWGTPCEDACRARAARLIRQCVADGGERQACVAEGREAYRECLTKCERPSCGEACRERAKRVYDACLATGADPERCAARARSLHQECLKRCERARCEEKCQHEARQAVRECLAAGGSEERCAHRGRTVYQECVQQCPGQPSIRPAP